MVVCFLPSGHADNNVGQTPELIQVRQSTRTGQHEVWSRAERRLGAPHPPSRRGEGSPPRHSRRPAACPAPEEGDPAGWGTRYLEILHFLRPASSATAAATPGAFLFFFTGIFRLPRQGGQGGRGGGSRSAAAPAPACQGPQRRPDPAAARPWVSSSGPAWHSAALRPAVPRLGRSRGRERRQRGTSSSLEEQAAQSDPEADDRGPEVTPQGASRGGAGRGGAGRASEVWDSALSSRFAGLSAGGTRLS